VDCSKEMVQPTCAGFRLTEIAQQAGRFITRPLQYKLGPEAVTLVPSRDGSVLDEGSSFC
jgi:hypothetical protein